MDTLSKPRWQPSRFIKASALLHAGAVAATALHPAAWPWCLDAIAADQALLVAAGMLPRCAWLGPNWNRLPSPSEARGEIAITLDDGPDPSVTPAILDLLDQYGAKASFFCIAQRALRYPELAREIVVRGHAVENHTLRHCYHFAFFGPDGLFRELHAASEALAETTGVRPTFFRAPAGLRSPLLDPVLSRLDLRLASWTRRGFDTRDGNPDVVLAKLLRGLAAGDILLLHDGNSAKTVRGNAVVLEVLPRLLDAIAACGLHPVTLRSAML